MHTCDVHSELRLYNFFMLISNEFLILIAHKSLVGKNIDFFSKTLRCIYPAYYKC